MKKFALESMTALLLAMFFGLFLFPCLSRAATDFEGKKILIVMSYHESVNMESEMQNVFNETLRGATLRYFWLDAKRKPKQLSEKAEQAYRIYEDFQPDAVFAVNDNAQEVFVVPYLKDRVTTPVVFAGVNDDASKYGFPSVNVTGVLEKKHYREGISFAQLINPRIRKIGVVFPADILSQRKNVEQIEKEKASYGAEISKIVQVASVEELKTALLDLNQTVDALIICNPTGLREQNGKPLKEMELYKIIVDLVKIPTIGVNDWEIEAGILCGVIKVNGEQASLAVKILSQIFRGTPISAIPLAENKNGRRFLNLITLKKLGLTLEPKAILGTEIISGRSGL